MDHHPNRTSGTGNLHPLGLEPVGSSGAAAPSRDAGGCFLGRSASGGVGVSEWAGELVVAVG